MKGSKEIRKARKQKEMERKPALVSIITVTYNARRALEKTMESVQEPTLAGFLDEIALYTDLDSPETW